MYLFPAIDIINGQCVGLKQGVYDNLQFFSHSPVRIAKAWEERGAKRLHVMDLDAARVGSPMNKDIIEEIIASVSIPVQVGGGIRTLLTIEEMLTKGSSRIVIGTKGYKDALFVEDAIKAFGSDKICIGIDGRDGLIADDGGDTFNPIRVFDFIKQMKERGVSNVIYTEISHSGLSKGPNLPFISELAKIAGINVTYSGGVATMTDIENIDQQRIDGIIICKALYDNKLDLTAAVNLFEKER